MKLDDILNFLFRTRRGLGVVAISTLGGALLTGGCFLTDVMACACDQTGCGVCAGCLSDLDSCVNELCTCGEPDCNGCTSCLFGDGGTQQNGNCTTDCGGLNRTCFTDCGLSCGGDCSEMTCNFINCQSTCTEPAKPRYDADLIWINSTAGDKIGTSTTSSYEEGTKVTQISTNNTGDYYEIEGFYTSYENGEFSDRIAGSDGKLTKDIKAEDLPSTIYVNCTELYFGESRQIQFRAVTMQNGEAQELNAEIDSMSVMVGMPIGEVPEFPTIEGYNFAELRNRDGYTVTLQTGENFHLYSYSFDPQDLLPELLVVYEPISLEVSFKVDNMAYILSDVSYNETFINLFTRFESEYPDVLTGDGSREFVGWSYQKEIFDPVSGQDRVTSGVTVYAIWSEYVTLTLHYTQGPESDVTSQQTYLSGTSVTLGRLEPVGRYTFEGWYLDAGFMQPFTDGSELYAQHLYAKWSAADKYMIYYYLDDSGIVYLRDEYTYSSTSPHILQEITDPSVIPVGYEFAGWCREKDLSDTPIERLPAGVYGDQYLYAKFEPRQYTIRLNPGAGTLGNGNTAHVTFGERYELPVPVRTGYDFAGWFLTNGLQCTDGEGISLNVFDASLAEQAESDSLQMVARWEVAKCTLIFYNWDNSVFFRTEVEYGTAPGHLAQLDVPPERPGYTFTGWSGTGVGDDFDENEIVTGDVRYWAEFSPNVYTITLDANGGTFGDGQSTKEVKITYGTAISLDVPTREGYTFLGWYDAEGNEVTSFDGVMTDEYAETGNVTLYAKWFL